MFCPPIAFLLIAPNIPQDILRDLSIVAIFILLVLNISQLMEQFSGGLPESNKEMLKLLFLPVIPTILQSIILGTSLLESIIMLCAYYLTVRMLALFVGMVISPFYSLNRNKKDWAIYWLVSSTILIIPLLPTYVMFKYTAKTVMQYNPSTPNLVIALGIFALALLIEVKKLVFATDPGEFFDQAKV
ncbi:MAG: hypothetical protein WC897_02565 [Candidatus Gracilibacteria bacterium]